MDRFAKLTFVTLLCCAGCGPTSTPTAKQPSRTTEKSAAVSTSATDVVSQFLDEIRRGGQDSQAHQLLTDKAQSELKRIGRTVQPIGSPDARFEVKRAEMVPDQPNSALVQSIWTEPNEDGTTSDFEVVWAVEQQAGDWRISGLVMEVDKSKPPVIIDFENGEMMAKLLINPDFESTGDSQSLEVNTTSGANSQAAAADPNLSR